MNFVRFVTGPKWRITKNGIDMLTSFLIFIASSMLFSYWATSELARLINFVKQSACRFLIAQMVGMLRWTISCFIIGMKKLFEQLQISIGKMLRRRN
ncbi:MAG: hypothetical protein CL810_06285 [Cobetia sp.]|nr:hypothetical protein KP05_14070 [Cobetia amphilecti]MBF09204.1 hypothetical protein [Cobetia sp.]MBK09158.1 hypothetical protein [Cobetia sp.]